MLISGKAIFLTRETLVDAVSAYVGGIFTNSRKGYYWRRFS